MSYPKNIFKIAVSIKQDADKIGLNMGSATGNDNWENLFDILIKDRGLSRRTKRLFFDRYYTQAVEASFKYLNSYVRKRAGRKLDGTKLMQNVFSAKNPVLKVSKLEGLSGEDAQRGYMEMFCGCLSGIRNPRVHEDSFEDDPETALEIIYLVHHLIRITKQADKVRD